MGFDGHKRINGIKIHAVVTRESLPVTVTIGSGREHEGRKLIPLMESIRIRPGRRRGRPRKRPSVLYADTKYDMPLNRFYLSRREAHQVADKKKRTQTGRRGLGDQGSSTMASTTGSGQ